MASTAERLEQGFENPTFDDPRSPGTREQDGTPETRNGEQNSRSDTENSRSDVDNSRSDAANSRKEIDKSWRRKKLAWIGAGVAIATVIALAITLPLTLTDDDDNDDHMPPPIPPTTSTSTSTSTTTPTSTSTTTTPEKDWLLQPCFGKQQNLPSCPRSSNPVLLVSLDGFRADYLLRGYTPVLEKLRTCGVNTGYMRSVYPTATFPNHYTLATGLYPESHGLVNNYMYDPEINATFSLGNEQKTNPDWYGGEPLWITAQKQGKRTATYFWPGSDVNISGVYPDIWFPFNASVPFEARVDTVLGWLQLPADQRPDFLTLYFNQPDKNGHTYGPDSDQTNDMLTHMDGLIGRLMRGLFEQRLEHCVNILITADHGMSPQSCSQTVFAQNYSADISDMFMANGYMGNVFPNYLESPNDSSVITERSGDFDVAAFVEDLTCRHPTMKVFTKATMPRRHHYGNSQRIGDVLLDMKDEWLVRKDTLGFCTGGQHGWDETYANMHALFLAQGPEFKEGFEAEPFENIELYNLICDILEISPAANNGTAGSLHGMLKAPSKVNRERFFDYDTCEVPDPAVNLTSCNCSTQINMTSDYVYMNVSDINLPFGEPLLSVQDRACVLHQPGFSTGYSQTVRAPLWLACILNNTQDSSKFLQTAMGFSSNESCILADTRVAPDCPPQLVVDGMQLTPLGGPGIDVVTDTAFLSSTLVPMYTGFRDGVWKSVLELVDDYVSSYGTLSVTMGPIYDYNNDGLWEGVINQTKFADSGNTLPIPTHIYVTLIKCKNPTRELSCGNKVDTLSLVIPHLAEIPNCLTMPMYLKDNTARVRDIELLTGLQLMAGTNRVIAAALRTYLPEDIWPTKMFPEWRKLSCPQTDLCQEDYKPLLLISLDGFRADYLLRNFTPTIERLSQCGAHAPYMRSVYPTYTFPNHYSIVTGLYPESHGIVSNKMYDIELEQRFSSSSSNRFDPRWWAGEPIWVTAQKQGLKAASYFWVGSDVNISGVYPETYKEYDGSATCEARVQDVVSYFLRQRDQRPDVVTLYFEEPDLAGHRWGPSDESRIPATLARVDRHIDDLMNGLARFDLHHCVNLVIIADHGMADVNCSTNIVGLSDYVDGGYLSSNFWVWDGAFGSIANTYVYNASVNGQIAPVQNPEPYDAVLANLTCAHSSMNTYTKASLPVRHHYSNHHRIDDLIVDMEDGWIFRRSSTYCRAGEHGYDNTDKSMEALFLAYGPDFKTNYTVEPFENIELYNLFTDILNITAAPNNGTARSLSHILRRPPDTVDTRVVSAANFTIDAYETYQNLGDFANVSSQYCNDSCESDVKVADLYKEFCCPHTDQDDLPFGLPMLAAPALANRNFSYLFLTDHVTLYDVDIRCSMWTSRTISRSEIGKGILLSDVEAMVRESAIQLVPDTEHSVAVEGVINVLAGMASNGVLRNRELNMFTGYAYDYNHDTLPDAVISNATSPSHYYIILSTCGDSGTRLEECKNLETSTYILPRQDSLVTCKAASDYLVDVEARIRDVELLAGFELYTALPVRRSARVRTYLPQRP